MDLDMQKRLNEQLLNRITQLEQKVTEGGGANSKQNSVVRTAGGSSTNALGGMHRQTKSSHQRNQSDVLSHVKI